MILLWFIMIRWFVLCSVDSWWVMVMVVWFFMRLFSVCWIFFFVLVFMVFVVLLRMRMVGLISRV